VSIGVGGGRGHVYREGRRHAQQDREGEARRRERVYGNLQRQQRSAERSEQDQAGSGLEDTERGQTLRGVAATAPYDTLTNRSRCENDRYLRSRRSAGGHRRGIARRPTGARVVHV